MNIHPDRVVLSGEQKSSPVFYEELLKRQIVSMWIVTMGSHQVKLMIEHTRKRRKSKGREKEYLRTVGRRHHGRRGTFPEGEERAAGQTGKGAREEGKHHPRWCNREREEFHR